MIVKFIEHFTSAPSGRKHAKELVPILANYLQISNVCGDPLVIDLDGGPGYAASFLDELFGGVVRMNGAGLGAMLDTGLVTIISDDEPYLIEEIRQFVFDAEMRMV